tara:strand:- start:142 stop:378 length:237 start_codon:yes stop_codon:yes gene_type:complete
MTYEIVLPKAFAEIAPPLKKHHDRLSQAIAHVYDMINNNDYDLILAELDGVYDSYDMAIAYRKHFKTDIAIIAINKIN